MANFPVKTLPLIFLVFAMAGLAGCEDRPESKWSPGDAPETRAASGETVDTKRYMVADELLGRLSAGEHPFVFDVRARASFEESHVEGAYSMPYGQVGEAELAEIQGLGKNSPIVTYCGCPHHLAGLAADQLIEMGYQQVRVLYEGYWYWRDNQFPIEGSEQQALTHLKFAGQVPQNRYANESAFVFLTNMRNGQLEAAPIDSQGGFQVDFHVFGHRRDDQFELRVGSLEADVIQSVRATPELETRIRLN